MSNASYHPGKTAASAKTLFSALGIPRDPLKAHEWIIAGVAPTMIHRLAEMVKIDVGSICRLAGISRSMVARKLKTDVVLSISQGARVFGVVQALDVVFSLYENDTVKVLSWLNRTAWALGGIAPADLLTTPMGAQAVIDLVGRIDHGVCQ